MVNAKCVTHWKNHIWPTILSSYALSYFEDLLDKLISRWSWKLEVKLWRLLVDKLKHKKGWRINFSGFCFKHQDLDDFNSLYQSPLKEGTAPVFQFGHYFETILATHYRHECSKHLSCFHKSHVTNNNTHTSWYNISYSSASQISEKLSLRNRLGNREYLQTQPENPWLWCLRTLQKWSKIRISHFARLLDWTRHT